MPNKSSGIIDWELDPSKLSDNPILPIDPETTQKLTKEVKKKKILEEYFKIFRGCEFWDWDRDKHAEWYKWTDGQCCFNHMIGLPEKLGVPQPMYEYEHRLFDMMINATKTEERFIWVKKATGLGITEFVLRMMAWLSLINDDFGGTEMCIITGQ